MNNLIEQQKKHFNEISERYFLARKHPNHLLLKDLIWKNFLKRNSVIEKEVRRVLEPMCGMAEGYDILSGNQKQQINYFGFDYSESMVKIAQNRKPNLYIKQCDVTTFKSTGEQFDLIILIGGLHHVYQRTGEVLKNLRESLRDGGYFLSLEPTHNNWISRRTRQRIYKANNLFDEDTEQGFEYHDLNRFFKDAGYEKVDEVYPGLLAYVLYYNPDAFPLLNVGGKFAVNCLFSIERLIWANWFGRKFSFATLGLWRKRSNAEWLST